MKGRDETTLMDDTDDTVNAETAICLVSGAVLKSGASRRSFSRSVRLFWFYTAYFSLFASPRLPALTAFFRRLFAT